jgi:MoaA/NifB/PqqE/SkfB family radical SAM enzyme
MPVNWPSWFSPRLDWLQVEISSRCNAACIYCPHTVYQDTWQSRLMPLDMFCQLSGTLAKTRLVYLQGWGEPFLNPQFFEMLNLAKAAGCQVGTTTNGVLLDEEMCLRLVQEGLNVIAFTLAGVDERNDRIRQGTRLEQVLQAIKILNRIKEQSGSTHPDIHIAYMLLRSQMDALEKLPGLLQGLNISQLIISTLDFVGEPALAEETICPQTKQEYEALCSRLEAVVETGRQSGLNIHYWLASPPQQPEKETRSVPEGELDLSFLLTQPDTCTENIRKAAFVSADGEVSPCVYMNIPVSAATYLAAGVELPYRRITFGNGQNARFDAIWRGMDYTTFRSDHQKHNLPHFCRACVRHRMLETEK